MFHGDCQTKVKGNLFIYQKIRKLLISGLVFMSFQTHCAVAGRNGMRAETFLTELPKKELDFLGVFIPQNIALVDCFGDLAPCTWI